MHSFEKPMNLVGLVFAGFMAITAWRLAWISGGDAPLIVVCLIGSVFFILTLIGFIRGKMMLVAAGVIASAVLFPTQWGIPPMIVGFILFTLIAGLRLFEMIEEGGGTHGSHTMQSSGNTRSRKKR